MAMCGAAYMRRNRWNRGVVGGGRPNRSAAVLGITRISGRAVEPSSADERAAVFRIIERLGVGGGATGVHRVTAGRPVDESAEYPGGRQ